jgi:hypothetical protein
LKHALLPCSAKSVGRDSDYIFAITVSQNEVGLHDRPAFQAQQVGEQMILAGMNVARLNFSQRRFLTSFDCNKKSARGRDRNRPRRYIIAKLPGPKISLTDTLVGPVTMSVYSTTYRWENPVKIGCPYPNNIVEQDRRRVKFRIQPMLGFKKFSYAQRVLIGIEFVQKILKG